MNGPPWLKTRSTGAKVHGVQTEIYDKIPHKVHNACHSTPVDVNKETAMTQLLLGSITS